MSASLLTATVTHSSVVDVAAPAIYDRSRGLGRLVPFFASDGSSPLSLPSTTATGSSRAPESAETRVVLAHIGWVPRKVVSPQANAHVVGIAEGLLCGVRMWALRSASWTKTSFRASSSSSRRCLSTVSDLRAETDADGEIIYSVVAKIVDVFKVPQMMAVGPNGSFINVSEICARAG